MIGEEALRISVEAATFGIVPNAREKTRHSFVFLMPGASEPARLGAGLSVVLTFR